MVLESGVAKREAKLVWGDCALLPLTFMITYDKVCYIYILLLLNCVEVSPIIGMMFDLVSDVYSKAIMPKFLGLRA